MNLAQNTYAKDHNNIFPPQNPVDDLRRSCPFFWDKELLVDVLTNEYGLNFQTLTCPGRDFPPWYVDVNTGGQATWDGDYFVSYTYLTGLPSATVPNGQGAFYDTEPSAAFLKVEENEPDKIVLADLNMNFYDARSWTTVNHSILDYPLEPVRGSYGFKGGIDLFQMLGSVLGSNRIHVDGSGRWVTLEEMGKDSSMPNPSNQFTSRYSHWKEIRPYYW